MNDEDAIFCAVVATLCLAFAAVIVAILMVHVWT